MFNNKSMHFIKKKFDRNKTENVHAKMTNINGWEFLFPFNIISVI